MADAPNTNAPAAAPAQQDRSGEVDVNAVKAAPPSPDNNLRPNDVAKYVENLIRSPNAENIDAILKNVDPTGEFSPTREPASRQAGQDDPAPARVTVDDKGKLHDQEGKFVSGKAIEDAEAKNQRRPEERRTDTPDPGERPAAAKYKTRDGREVDPEEVEIALQVTDREAAIRRATDRRMAELDQRETEFRTRSSAIEEAESFRDMILNEPERAVKFYEATTGKAWPGARRAMAEAEDTGLEPDEAAARGVRRPAREITDEDIDARVERKVAERLQRFEHTQTQKSAEQRWWGDVGSVIEGSMKGIPEFEGIEADVEVKIGRELGRSIKAGLLSPPNLARRHAGSAREAIEKEVKTIAGKLLSVERKRLNGWAATRFKEHAETVSSTPNPGRGAATISGASHLDPNTVELPGNIRGIEKMAMDLLGKQ